MRGYLPPQAPWRVTTEVERSDPATVSTRRLRADSQTNANDLTRRLTTHTGTSLGWKQMNLPILW